MGAEMSSDEGELRLRPGRQLTLPAELCAALDLKIGDRLEVSVTDGGLLVRPRKALALRALCELRRGFADSSVSEKELQAEGRRIREELSRSRYGEG